MKVRGLFNVC